MQRIYVYYGVTM